jgi:phosphate transport system protein
VRVLYRDQLAGLWRRLGELAERQHVAIERATASLLDANGQLAELVITEQETTDALQEELEQHALRILAQQAPVAGDLRLVLTSLPVSASLARMGALAEHVAKAARLRVPESAVADRLRDTVTAIGDTAAGTAETLARAITERDTALAAEVAGSDDGMDALHRKLYTQLLSADWPYGVPAAVDAALLGRYYERFADQAVGVARRIGFIITGDLED